jgi:hypothetical protein
VLEIIIFQTDSHGAYLLSGMDIGEDGQQIMQERKSESMERWDHI